MSNQPFFTILRNAHLYAPEDQGIQDLLIAGEKIAGIGKGIEPPKGIECREIDLKGARVLPGFIDGHVHMIGGGGEGGYHTRTPELLLSKVTTSGVTTVCAERMAQHVMSRAYSPKRADWNMKVFLPTSTRVLMNFPHRPLQAASAKILS